MNCTATDELRTTTQAAFKQHGGQAAAAKALNVSRQYVWQVLNGECGNDDVLLKLSEFILGRIEEQKQKDVQKKSNTLALRAAMAL